MKLKYEVIKVAEDIELHYFRDWIEDANRLFLEAEKLSFSEEIVTMYAKANVIRRRTVDYGLPYSYNATAKPSIEWEPLPWALKQRLEQQFKTDFLQCACNEFVDHEAYIGPHHDKATIVGDEKREPLFIASISLGAMRRMVLTPPDAKLKGVPITVNGLSKVPGSRVIELAPGSLVLFTNAFNRVWKHSIPKDLKHLVSGKRISLTYRHF
jgi:alkylated DNA repair dioxygenase AlkB